jgi:glutathione S-transferase
MPILHHLPLSPFCRKVRVTLGEKALPFELKEQRVWDRDRAFLALNPAGMVPALELEDGGVIADSNTIVAFLDEIAPDPPLIGDGPMQRAETRRLTAWFDDKFNREVTRHIYGEKVQKRLAGAGAPDSSAIRAGQSNMRHHLDYIAWLAARRNWLAGDDFSLADITAAAHLSTLDFLDDIRWTDHDEVKLWYQRVKSRPSFRPLLADRIIGFRAPIHYADLDF